MNPTRIIIIDDELPSIKSLLWELEAIDMPIEIIDTCSSAKQGIESILKNRPDLVFLDIEMPHMNGFEMLAELPVVDFQVVFITAYDEYAVKAFEINACDYLLKPVDHDLLMKALTRYHSLTSSDIITQRLEGLFETMRKQGSGLSKLALSTVEGLEFIRINTIIRCESSSNYTFVYTLDGQKRLVSKTLRDIEESLKDNHFYRVHKSHLVNLEYVKRYIRGKTGQLILEDDSTVPVSKTRKNFLDELL